MRFALVLGLSLSFLAPVVGHAQMSCDEDVVALGLLYEIRDLMLDPRVSSWDVTSRIDERLEELREPLADGSYRWVNIVRPSNGGPVERKEQMVHANVDRDELDFVQASAEIPYAVRIVVPRKRSLFRGNEPVWVETVKIRAWVDGEVDSTEERIGRWMNPETLRTFDFGEVVDRAEVELEVATDEETSGRALVEIHFEQGVPVDDPENPNYEAVQALERLRSDFSPMKLDLEIGRIEQRLFPSATVLPVTVMVRDLREYERLRSSDDEEEKEEAEELLDKVIKALPKR